MTDINVLLRSPAWWFGAVFVALMISVVGAFLKDGLAHLYSRARRYLTVSQEKRCAEDDEYVNFLSQHPDLLSVEMAINNSMLIRAALMLVILTALPVIVLFKHTFPHTGVHISSLDPLVAIEAKVTIAFETLGTIVLLILIFSHQAWYRLLRRAYAKAKARRHNEAMDSDREQTPL